MQAKLRIYRIEGVEGLQIQFQAYDSRAKAVFMQGSLSFTCTHRPPSSSFLGLPSRILNMNHKKELLRGPMGRAIFGQRSAVETLCPCI